MVEEKETTDRWLIDGHKLWCHPDEVESWRNRENIFPIYMEITPAGGCNHRCIFCACDFMGHKRRFLDEDVLKRRLTEMAQGGVKAVMYAGEGEPLLHPRMSDIVNHTKEVGIDVAFTTNGVLLAPRFSDQALKDISWIKVSIAAGTPENYARIHQTKEGDFNLVIKNLTYAANLRKERGFSCTLGAQILLLPGENDQEVGILAETVRDAGLDYLVVKPYAPHPMNPSEKYDSVNYGPYFQLGEILQQYNTPNFKVIFRQNAVQNLTSYDRGYNRCHALPFWAYIDAEGNAWGCSVFLTDPRFCYGNINEQTFSEIWNGERRAEHLKMMKEFDAGECRRACRMNLSNQYLHNLSNLSSDEFARHIQEQRERLMVSANVPEHMNFI